MVLFIAPIYGMVDADVPFHILGIVVKDLIDFEFDTFVIKD